HDIGAPKLCDQLVVESRASGLLGRALRRRGKKCAESGFVEDRMRVDAEISYGERRFGVGITQTLDDSIRQPGRVRGFAPYAGVDLQHVHDLAPWVRVEYEANIFVADLGQKPLKWITLFPGSNN